MPGLEILLIILIVSSLPAIIVFLWFRLCRYPFTVPQFVFSLLAGAASVFPALFFQRFLGGFFPEISGRWGIFAKYFLYIAFTEEFSRLIMLFILFFLFRRFGSWTAWYSDTDETSEENQSPGIITAAAAGLVAGFGFAILETANLRNLDLGNMFLRAFTTAPLHGACGARVGVSLVMFRKKPVPAVFRFLTAVAIHGVFNFMLIIPGAISSIAAALVALSALATSVLAIRGGMGKPL